MYLCNAFKSACKAFGVGEDLAIEEQYFWEKFYFTGLKLGKPAERFCNSSPAMFVMNTYTYL